MLVRVISVYCKKWVNFQSCVDYIETLLSCQGVAVLHASITGVFLGEIDNIDTPKKLTHEGYSAWAQW